MRADTIEAIQRVGCSGDKRSAATSEPQTRGEGILTRFLPDRDGKIAQNWLDANFPNVLPGPSGGMTSLAVTPNPALAEGQGMTSESRLYLKAFQPEASKGGEKRGKRKRKGRGRKKGKGKKEEGESLKTICQPSTFVYTRCTIQQENLPGARGPGPRAPAHDLRPAGRHSAST